MKEESVIRDSYEPILEWLAKHAVLDLETLRFNDENIVHLAAICSYLYITQVSLSVKALYEKGSHYSYPILLRSLLEAFADLTNILEHEGYAQRMVATYYHEKIRVLENAPKFPDDTLFQYIAEHQEGNKKIRETYEGLKKDGFSNIGIAEKFKLAVMSDLYAGVYWHFCLYTHANMGVLEERHIESLEGDNLQVVFSKDVGADYLVRCLDTLVSLWIDSSLKIHRELGSPQAERYKDLQNSLAVARTKLKATEEK